MKKLLTATGLALAVLTGCTQSVGNQSSSEQTPVADVQEASAPVTESNNDPSQKNVVQVALGSKDHTTLVAALQQANLVAPLEKTGPFTVFAPTNAAFEKLPAGTLDDLMKPEKKDVLADILEYHVSVGVYNENMFQDGQVIGEVNSQNITISKKDGKTKINGTASIVAAIPTSNGIVYVIDEVLLPPKK
jgi:uncharacterized surface protein with fasciclin (FAS1) repeats